MREREKGAWLIHREASHISSIKVCVCVFHSRWWQCMSQCVCMTSNWHHASPLLCQIHTRTYLLVSVVFVLCVLVSGMYRHAYIRGLCQWLLVYSTYCVCMCVWDISQLGRWKSCVCVFPVHWRVKVQSGCLTERTCFTTYSSHTDY